jgi:hypothetical protein
MAYVVDHLPSKCQVLSSSPSTKRKKKSHGHKNLTSNFMEFMHPLMLVHGSKVKSS